MPLKYEQNRGKLYPGAKRSVFVGYFLTQQGYKCYDPIKKNVYHHRCHIFLSLSHFLNFVFRERGREASKYLHVFQLEESSHVPRTITLVQLKVESGMLTTEKIGLGPSLLPSHDHTSTNHGRKAGTKCTKVHVYVMKNQLQCSTIAP